MHHLSSHKGMSRKSEYERELCVCDGQEIKGGAWKRCKQMKEKVKPMRIARLRKGRYEA